MQYPQAADRTKDEDNSIHPTRPNVQSKYQSRQYRSNQIDQINQINQTPNRKDQVTEREGECDVYTAVNQENRTRERGG
jgi:hypothetical protein